MGQKINTGSLPVLSMSTPTLQHSGTREMTTGSGVPWTTSLVPSLLLLWKLQPPSNAFQIFLGVLIEPLTCTPLLKPVFTEATWHLPISIALVPILQDELGPQTLTAAAAADQQYGCLEAAEG